MAMPGVIFFAFLLVALVRSTKGIPQAIVHIGPHKTSSSHIQSSLFEISQELDNANFFWPTQPDGKRIGPKGVANFAYALKDMGHISVQADLDIMDQFIQQSLQKNRSIIMSSEEFDDMAPQYIASLKKHLTGFNVTIVFVYRELLSQLISLHFELNRFEQPVSFSTSLSSYLFGVLDNLPLILKPVDILGRYAAVFGEKNIRVIDLAGTNAAGKDIAHVLVCQIAGVLCDRADLFLHPANPNPSYSLIPAQVFSFYKTYVEQQQCALCGAVRSEYTHFLARYTNHTIFEGPPRVIESKLSMLRPYAQLTDISLRAKYSSVILEANQKANFQDMWKVHVSDLDVEKFVTDVPWNNWIHEEYLLARAEKRLCHCLK